jgi:D-lyxose ketol-isomerase
MRRSDINQLVRSAEKFFVTHGWTLPPRAEAYRLRDLE